MEQMSMEPYYSLSLPSGALGLGRPVVNGQKHSRRQAGRAQLHRADLPGQRSRAAKSLRRKSKGIVKFGQRSLIFGSTGPTVLSDRGDRGSLTVTWLPKVLSSRGLMIFYHWFQSCSFWLGKFP